MILSFWVLNLFLQKGYNATGQCSENDEDVGKDRTDFAWPCLSLSRSLTAVALVLSLSPEL